MLLGEDWVGAMRAAWKPDSTQRSIAERATSVLPEPTSPWRRRFMGRVAARSARISAMARFARR